MSTKISNLPQRIGISGNSNDTNNINGAEFFPIVDNQAGINQTYRLSLSEIFNTDGVEKVTGLSITEGKLRNTETNPSNKFFTLEYIDEANVPHTLRIQKYVIEDDDVAFTHIHPDGYITSTQKISEFLTDEKLATAKSVEEHVNFKQDLYDATIKEYIGDDDSGVLVDFATLTNVATDFVNLLDGVKPELNTFKKIEEQFDTIDYSDKIGVSQVNNTHFRTSESGGAPLFPNRLNIREFAITESLIRNSAVTNIKISDSAVSGSKIAAGSISNDKIVEKTITEDKIVDANLSHSKLSLGAPQWDNAAVNILKSLNVGINGNIGDITTSGGISQKGKTFSIYNAESRGAGIKHPGRALTHAANDKLSINPEKDYTGGVNIKGVVTVDDMSEALIVIGGERAVVTKEYVDARDILVNPIGSERIQPDAIQNFHLTDDCVGEFEIQDDSITSAKIENIGPQWTTDGDVTIINNLYANGQTFNLGNSSSGSGAVNLVLYASNSNTSAHALIARETGNLGNLKIDSGGGLITLSPGAGSANSVEISTVTTSLKNAVNITSTSTSSIGNNNLSNIPLLIGDTSNGIGIDKNKILHKGDNLFIGVADETKRIFFTSGEQDNVTAVIRGDGEFIASGEITSSSGIIGSPYNTNVVFRAGDQSSNIKLTALASAEVGAAHQAFYNANKHTFKTLDERKTALEIDSTSQQVKLSIEGIFPKSLITKNYVDTKKIAPSDLTAGGPSWQDNGIVQTKNALFIKGTTNGNHDSVGVYTRNIIGENDGVNSDTLLRLKGGNSASDASIIIHGNQHSNQNQVVIRGKQTQVQTITGTNALDIQEVGRILAPLQTINFVNSHSRAVATKEYVLSEVGKTFPDLNYVLRNGTNGMNFGDLTWNDQQGYGLSWDKGALNASIKFHVNPVNAFERLDNRLEFNLGGIGAENFLFTYTTSRAGRLVTGDLLKLGRDNFSYKGDDIWHDGNTAGRVTTDRLASSAVNNLKLATNAVSTAKIANLNVTAAKLANSSVTTGKIDGGAVDQTKVSVPNGHVLGREPSGALDNLVPIIQELDNSQSLVTAAAIKAYIDAAVAGISSGVSASTVRQIVSGYSTAGTTGQVVQTSTLYRSPIPIWNLYGDFQSLGIGGNRGYWQDTDFTTYPAGVTIQGQTLTFTTTKTTGSIWLGDYDINFYPSVQFFDSTGKAISPVFGGSKTLPKNRSFINVSHKSNYNVTNPGEIIIPTFRLENTATANICMKVLGTGRTTTTKRHASTVIRTPIDVSGNTL